MLTYNHFQIYHTYELISTVKPARVIVLSQQAYCCNMLQAVRITARTAAVKRLQVWWRYTILKLLLLIVYYSDQNETEHGRRVVLVVKRAIICFLMHGPECWSELFSETMSLQQEPSLIHVLHRGTRMGNPKLIHFLHRSPYLGFLNSVSASIVSSIFYSIFI